MNLVITSMVNQTALDIKAGIHKLNTTTEGVGNIWMTADFASLGRTLCLGQCGDRRCGGYVLCGLHGLPGTCPISVTT